MPQWETAMQPYGKFLMPFCCSLVVCCASLAVAAESDGTTQTVTRAGTHASVRGPERTFTGNVRVDRIFNANDAAPFTAAYVTFEPGARSFWHSHVAGQHLIVVFGKGLTGTADGKVVEIMPGDEIWCPPDVKHWHGAAPDTGMTHIAITGVKDGKNTNWMEPVTDEQYNAR